MARKRSGLAGFLNVHKPVGPTSHDVISLIRRWSGERQVGHGGTLDPLASGVLPIALGAYTRLLDFIPEPKVYEAEITFGVATDTYDREGSVTAQADPSALTQAQVETALAAYVGDEVWQHPPVYSAVKREGQHSYDLARTGALTPPPARPVRVYRIDLLEFALPMARVRVVCGKGMYIRSLAHDLGQALGCGAHLSTLIRTANGPFALQHSLGLEELEAGLRSDPAAVLLSGGFPFPHWPSVRLPEERVGTVLRGSQLVLTVAEIWPPKPLVVAGVAVPPERERCLAYDGEGRLLAMLQRQGGLSTWQPFKVFPPEAPLEAMETGSSVPFVPAGT